LTEPVEPFARCRGLSRTFETSVGGVRALPPLDASFRLGEITAVVGPSGTGKSTLLRILAALDRPSGGSLTVGGRELADASPPVLRAYRHATVTYVAQKPADSFVPHLAVLEQTPSHTVLHDVSFTVEPGQLVALVGPSGAGKTTISSLVPRLYDVRGGAIRINGLDVRDATLASMRETIGVVTQDAHLFHDTIRANLVYARPDATEADMRDALRAAQILPLIDALPNGLDTVVGERGYRFSGGEKQRIAIARLLLKAPRIVVLDEATAHLDSESEVAVQAALDTALAGRTSIVIAHRLSTVQHAARILVVSGGRIAECGTHEELLASDGVYTDLYETQFKRQAPVESYAPSS